MMKINRRDFLKAIGLGSTATAAACSADPISWDPMVPIEHAYPYIAQPEQIEPGNATYITSVCGQCSEGCGILAKNREGRVLNLEGNTQHPLSKGKLCFRGQTGLQETYSPDRLQLPVKGNKIPASDDGYTAWEEALKQVAAASTGSVTWIGRPRTGASAALVKQFITEGLNGKVLYWDELESSALRSASRKVFGINGTPKFDLSNAHTILNFGMDFLNAQGTVSLANGWAMSKDPNHGGFISKMYSVGSRIGLTNTNADIHLSVNAGTEAHLAYAVAKKLADKKKYSGAAAALLAGINADELIGASGANATLVTELVDSLAAHGSVALPGGTEASAVAEDLAIAVLLINEVAGNFGQSVAYGNTDEFGASSNDVMSAITAAKGGTLFVDGVDLGYAFSSKSGISDALAAVKNLIVFANEMNDGIPANALVLPVGTAVEKWGDSESVTGVHSLSQAAMKPVNGNVIMSAEDILLKVAASNGITAAAVIPVPTEDAVEGEEGDIAEVPAADVTEEGGEEVAQPTIAAAPAPGLDAGDFFSYLKSWWEATVYPKYKATGGAKRFREFWMDTQKTGFFTSTLEAPTTQWALGAFTKPAAPTFEGSGDYNLVLFPHPYTGLGRHSNRPWAREIPDPITNFSWGTWVEVHPNTAEKIGLRKDKGVTLTTANGSIEAGWYGVPGVKEDTLAVVMGGGKSNSGRYAALGANPLSLIGHGFNAAGDVIYANTKASIAQNDQRNSPGPQNDLTKSDTLTKNDRNVNFTTSMADFNNKELTETGSVVPEHHLPETSMAMRSRKTDNRFHKEGKDTTPKLTDMYPEPDHPTYRFAMAIDLNKCNGCNACAAACYAENNVSVVGPEQVRLGRNMGWIRMSRYWEGTDVQKTGKPDVRFQPVMCQHCSHAPCEGVCPVLATYHNLDGLNAMIYNRCVGTRYCANNCPYSARRFNYHTFKWPESFNLMLNPNVLVREMGVMEKCTFCVQRIRDFKDEWRDSRDFKQGEQSPASYDRITACASACPSDAITFGNLKDEKSAVSAQFQDRRSFKMLNELNTKPGVAYLTRIVHADESFLHHGGGHGDHGEGHGDHHGAGGHDDHGHKKDDHGTEAAH